MTETTQQQNELKQRAYWQEYGAVMATIRELEVKAHTRWGGQMLFPTAPQEAQAMRQLRQALEALEVGFE